MPPGVEPLKLFRTVAVNPRGARALPHHGRLPAQLRHGRSGRPRGRDPPHLRPLRLRVRMGRARDRLRASARVHRRAAGRDRPWRLRTIPPGPTASACWCAWRTSCTTRGTVSDGALGSCCRGMDRRPARRAAGRGRLLPPGLLHGQRRRRRARGRRRALPGPSSVPRMRRVLASSRRRSWSWCVLLVVNAIVTDRETKEAAPTIGRIVDLPDGDVQVREDGPAVGAATSCCCTASPARCAGGTGSSPRSPRDHRVVRIDLLGHGGSEKPTRRLLDAGPGRAGRGGDAPSYGCRPRSSPATRWAARSPPRSPSSDPTCCAAW